jgi:NAD+ synthase (glutamine-hydrolysing)
VRLIRIGLVNVRNTVGASRSNTDRAIEFAHALERDGVTLGVFQEQLISGYPAEDLVQWNPFVEVQRAELFRFAERTRELGAVFVLGVTVMKGAHRYNAGAVVHRGRVLGVVPKEKLPTYNVFYEQRTFSAGAPGMDELLWDEVPFGDLLFEFDWGVLGVEVCEDVWSSEGPMRRRCQQGAEVIANLSASPYRVGVQSTRREMLATRSADHLCVIAYANQVGGQDGLIFDGGGFVAQGGRIALEADRFRVGYQCVNVDLDRIVRLRAENTTWRGDALDANRRTPRCRRVKAPDLGSDRRSLTYPLPPHGSFFLPGETARTTARAEFCEELLDALALGLGDYFEKCRFGLIGVALSGGRDSLLALLIAWRFLVRSEGPEGVRKLRTFYMPTRYSSGATREAAETIAREVGASFEILNIDEAFQRELEATRAMLKPEEKITPITEQNIQARIRGTRMWNWSNSVNGLFLQTGNMSEKAMGYTTIGGDLEGGLSVISNLPKTVVIYLLEYLRETTGFSGIAKVFAQPAGPELAADQEGEKELMPFQVLDACFALYASEKLSPREVKTVLPNLFSQYPREQLDAWVDRFFVLFTRSIYKWVQAPLGLHVGNLDLDRERALQLPVVESNEWAQSPD